LIETLICLAVNVIEISLWLSFSAQAKDAREKEIKEKNQIFSIKSPSLWVGMTLLILPAVVQLVLNKSETPHISASLRFDTIQPMVRQFGQRRLQEKVEW
jgi:hypothetical protein